MTCIATDANFLEHPVPVDDGANAGNTNAIAGNVIITPGAIRVNVAERYDVIIDFGKYNVGAKLYLTDVRSQSVNPGNVFPGLPPTFNIGNVVMRFDVVNRETWFPADTPAIPETLCTYPPICEPDTTFQWNFDRDPAGSVPRLFRINQPCLRCRMYRSIAFSRAPVKSGSSTITPLTQTDLPTGPTLCIFTSRNFAF